MSTMILMLPLTPNAISTSPSRGTGVANLLTPSPKEVFVDQAADGSAVQIRLDLGSAQTIDTLFLGFTNAADGATMSISGSASSYSGALPSTIVFPTATDVPGARRHSLVLLTAPVSVRYIQVNVAQPSGAAAFQAGILAVGLAFRPVNGRDYGSGQQPIDTGSTQALLGGGFGIGQGVVKSSFNWTMGDLSDAELRVLRAMTLQAGQTAPLLLCEDPSVSAGQTELIHWGLLTKLQAYERFSAGHTKWAFALEDWV